MSTISETVAPHQPSFFESIGQTAGEAVHKAHDAARQGLTAVQHTVEWMDRKVTYYCDAYLPHPLNVLAKAAIKAAPFIVINACLPLPLRIASIIGIIAYNILTTDSSHTSSLPKHLSNAFAFRCFFSVGTNATAFAQTGEIASLLWTITNLGFGVLASLQSHLIQDIIHAPARQEAPAL